MKQVINEILERLTTQKEEKLDLLLQLKNHQWKKAIDIMCNISYWDVEIMLIFVNGWIVQNSNKIYLKRIAQRLDDYPIEDMPTLKSMLRLVQIQLNC